MFALMSSKIDSTQLVCLVGQTCSGKTTFKNQLELLGWKVFGEVPPDENPHLIPFYNTLSEKPNKHVLGSQLCFLRDSFKQAKQIDWTTDAGVIKIINMMNQALPVLEIA